MKVKVLCRNPDDYVRETSKDIQRGEWTASAKLMLHEGWTPKAS